jgi:hypothetical protein
MLIEVLMEGAKRRTTQHFSSLHSFDEKMKRKQKLLGVQVFLSYKGREGKKIQKCHFSLILQ